MTLLNNEKKNIISAKTQPRIAAPAFNKDLMVLHVFCGTFLHF